MAPRAKFTVARFMRMASVPSQKYVHLMRPAGPGLQGGDAKAWRDHVERRQHRKTGPPERPQGGPSVASAALRLLAVASLRLRRRALP